MNTDADTKIEWQSSYGLAENEDSNEFYSVSVTKFKLGDVHVDIAQSGEDIYKEFTSVSAAYDWLTDFVGGGYLQLDSAFDFREIVY